MKKFIYEMINKYKMVIISQIDKILLYSIQSEKKDIVNELKLNEESEILKIMRNNFGRFWNTLTKEQRNKYINLSIGKEELYVQIEKIIRYSDEVTREIFLKEFMNIETFEDKYSAYYIYTETDDDDKLDNLKHNILRFWISMNDEKKIKFVNIINKYWEKNSYVEYFYQKKEIFTIDKDDIVNIDYFDKEPYRDIEILFCVDQILENIDLLYTEDVLYIDCSENNIKKLDDLPINLKSLKCIDNKLKTLNNLPQKIKYLDCSLNEITEILNIPKEIIFLKCSSNDITFLEKLPNDMKILICDNNKISSLDNLHSQIFFKKILRAASLAKRIGNINL